MSFLKKKPFTVRTFFLFTHFALLMMLSSMSNAVIVDASVLQPSFSEEWKTLETENFNIHFTSKNELFAQRVAAIAEKVHAKLTVSFQWDATEKTEVTINDAVDFPNGSATQVPFNQFSIFMTPPTEGTLLTNSGWIELVFTHEYAHVLQLDQVGGVPEAFRSVFGKPSFIPTLEGFIIFPVVYGESFLPEWSIEGIAVHAESASGFGRVNTGVFAGQMREELKKGFLTVTEINYPTPSRWPFNHSYLYGSYFFKFVKDVYGEEKAFEFFIKYRGEFIPYSLDDTLDTVFGKDLPQIWDEYLVYLNKHFQPQLQGIKERKKNHGKVVEKDPFFNSSLAPTHDTVFYYHNDLFTYPKIMQVDSKGERKEIMEVRSVVDMDWHHKGGLLIVKSDFIANTNLRNDVYLLTPEQLAQDVLSRSDLRRITEDARVHTVVWSSDATALYAVRIDGGVSYLVRIELSGSIEVLHTFEVGEVMGDFDLSVDGKNIIASIRRNHTGWNIETFDLESRDWMPTIYAEGVENNPVYSADGKSIYYLSHDDEQVEIHRLDRKSKVVEVITQTEGYVIEFELSSRRLEQQSTEKSTEQEGNQLIWVTKYTGTGQQIEVITNPKAISQYRLQDGDFSAFNRLLPMQSDFNPSDYNAIRDYSAFDNIGTKGWVPILRFGDIQTFGIFVSGQDTLGFHQWLLAPTYFSNEIEGNFGGIASYNFFNRFSLTANRFTDVGSVFNTSNDVDFSEEQTILQAVGHYPLNRLDSSWIFSVGGVNVQSDTKFRDSLSFEDQNTVENVMGASVQYQTFFRNARANQISGGYGYNIRYESYGVFENTDFSGDLAVFNFQKFFQLARNYSLSLLLDTGFGGGSIRPFELGGNFMSSGITTTQVNPIGLRRYSLSGYQRNTQALSGNQFIKLGTELYFPITNVGDGFIEPPIGVSNIYARVYSETASAWSRPDNNDYYSNIGIEIITEYIIAYSLNLPFTVGFAYGLDNQLGEAELYISVGI